MQSGDDALDPEFVEVLRCPDCPDRHDWNLTVDNDRLRCACPRGRTWEIVAGVPDLRPCDRPAPAPPARLGRD
ncbi:MAG: hypothetical protein ACKO5K_09750 [Armatimonadota bacterium]